MTDDHLLTYARRMRKQPTPAERRLWQALRARQCDGQKWRRQVPIGPFIVDFFCPDLNLIVELDGATHADPANDSERTAWLHAKGLRIIRFWNNDVTGNLAGVLQILADTPGFMDTPERHC